MLRNRIIAAPMGGGFVDKHKIESLASKSKGGAALVLIGSCNVDYDRSLIAPGWPGLYPPHMETFMDQLNAIHQYGAKASIQLMHAGLWAYVPDPNKRPFGPVDTVRNIGKDADDMEVQGMTPEDMNTVADNFAATAVRAQKLGFDMCMLHFAHGWLPAQFLSPKFNKRNDEYGGSLENRARFPRMIVDRVRNAVGPDYPLDMRISGDERCPDGIDPADVIRFVQMIEDKIDMVHVSSGIDKYMDLTTYVESPQLYPHLINVELAEKMKQSVKIPVVTVGGITMPDEAEQVLSEGKADCIAMSRSLLADPQWPNKARNGKPDDIVPCLRCLSCYHVATECFTHGCAVNPVFTREDRVKADLLLNTPGKKVVIVGGGPAGLKAAVTAAERGHKVTLYEKDSKLGGLINVIARLSAKGTDGVMKRGAARSFLVSVLFLYRMVGTLQNPRR
jgi:2,4-dienoyl-CoA reductase-like NADH-dependent reductase (Old Yellow Enzyme family)